MIFRGLRFLFTVMFLFAVFVSAKKEPPVWKYQQSPEEYETMTMEIYEVVLAKALEREKNAKEKIAEEQALIASIRQQLLDGDNRIAQTIQEKYLILGITEEDIINTEAEIASIRSELELLLGLLPDELLKRAEDIKLQESRIISLKEKPISYLWRIRDQIRELDELLDRVKANLPDKLVQYTVRQIPGRNDCLSRIAEYSEIYDDATQWPLIYRANKTVIDKAFNQYTNRTEDPKYSKPEDLIFPGQIFEIPRE
jgi:nucleoid-associated protein YgaU